MSSRWIRRLLTAAALLALLAVLGSAWFAHRLMVEVLTGRAFSALAQPEIDDPLKIGYRGDPGRAFGMAWQDVELETPLGPAPAWLIPAPGADGKRLAIFVHGIGGAREDGYPFLPQLHQAGLPVLLITYRNDAGAPPAPDGLHAFGLTEWRDLEAAYDWAKSQGYDSVLLVAASMGGSIAGQFLARSDRAGMTAGVVLDAPALDFPATLRHITRRMALPLGGIGTALALPAFGFSHGLDLSQARVTNSFIAFKGPLLIFHGEADRIVPPETSKALLAARGGDTVLVLTPGDHLQSRDTAPERFRTALAKLIAALPR
ncbi:hypothetical protein GCM10007291_28530 [Gemmobacter nanjingensis]|uniref:Serine aminopeptidase S33 domain-containing protein n=1 Tax=Gemmobacter nanjingensis TaxID=488454 RepID=A0ABQ3FJU3_9RHOB|nr:hypothetical protein [Gemmobacter nanjingensis]GHC26839.1 hypothetical protein GCM10007291_28530 [Gemmobacter nanjingensis]